MTGYLLIMSFYFTGKLLYHILDLIIYIVTSFQGGFSMRKKILTLFLTGFLLGSSSAAFAGEPVKVTFPTFPVTLNNQTLNNDYSQYPILVYKDLTYVPMPYYDCRLLGLKTDWSLQNGLAIDKNSDVFNEYERTVNSQKKRTSLTAQIAD